MRVDKRESTSWWTRGDDLLRRVRRDEHTYWQMERYVGTKCFTVTARQFRDGRLVPVRIMLCGVGRDRRVSTWRRHAPKVMTSMRSFIGAVLRAEETHNGKNT